MDAVVNLLAQYWSEALFSLLCLGVGAWWGKRRARGQWAKKEFLNRINASLNIMRDGKLQIRTIFEKDVQEIFLNSVAVDKVVAACGKTSENNPLLPLDKDDAWYLLNAVLNEISEQFAEGHFKKDMGLEVSSETYLIGLTFERAGAMRTHKVRAMIIKKSALLGFTSSPLMDTSKTGMSVSTLNALNPKTIGPKLERPHHVTRVETLRKLAEEYQRQPEQFIEVEICL